MGRQMPKVVNEMEEDKKVLSESNLNEVSGSEKITGYDKDGHLVTYLKSCDVYTVVVRMRGGHYRTLYFRDELKARDCAMRFRGTGPQLQQNVFADVEFSDDDYLKYNFQ